MVDLKKLVISFLVLAALGGFAAFAFSNLFQGQDPSPRTASLDKNFTEDDITQISKNVFYETIPGPDSSSDTGPEDTDLVVAITPSSNLTENLAQNLALEMLKANPDGPVGSGADFSVNNLDETAIEKAALLGTGDLGLFSKVKKEDLIYSNDNSDEAIAAYIEKVNAVLKGTVGGKDFGNLASKEAGPEMAGAAQVVLAQAVTKIYEISAPSSLASLHQELATTFSNRRKIFDAISAYEEDPLKAMVVFQTAKKIIDRDLASFQAEFSKTKFPEPNAVSGNQDNSFVSLISDLVSVKTAEAQLFVPIDCLGPSCTSFQVTETAATTGNLLQKLFEWGKKILTEQLKDKLIGMMIRQTTTWVQGGGKPKWVTNWKGFLEDAANRAAGSVLEKEWPQLCQSFGRLLRVAMVPKTQVPSLYGRCTLSQVVGGLTRVYERFESGDWVVYGQSLRPYGNIWGSAIATREKVAVEALAAEEAARSKAESSQGFSPADGDQSTKTCGATTVQDLNDVANQMGQSLNPGMGWGARITMAEEYSNAIGEDYIEGTLQSATDTDFETCKRNAWREGTPGSLIAHSVYTSADAPLHRIVNAQDLIGLMSAVVDSLLNRVIRAAGEGLNNLFTDKEVVQPNGQRSAYQPGTYTLNQFCNGLWGDALLQCLQQSNQTENISNTNSSSTSPIGTCEGLTGQAFTDCVNAQGLGSGNTSSSPNAVNNPPTIVSFSGPTTVDLSGPFQFVPPQWTVRAVDPEGQQLTYKFEWGDGQITTPPSAQSGANVSAFHNYACFSFSCQFTLKVIVSDGFLANNVSQSVNIVVLP